VVGAKSPLTLEVAANLGSSAQVIMLDKAETVSIKGTDTPRIEVGCDVTNPNQLRAVFSELNLNISSLLYMPRVRIRRALGQVSTEELVAEYTLTVTALIELIKVINNFGNNQQSPLRSVVALTSPLAVSVSRSEGIGYHLAKSALNQAIRVLATTLGDHGTRVNGVSIGWISKGDLFEQSVRAHPVRNALEATQATGQAPSSQDIANVISFLLSEKSSAITGQIISAEGGSQLREAFDIGLKAQGFSFREIIE